MTAVPHARRTPERLSLFSDAVFAVLITVLVLDLHPPELPTFKALLSLWPRWLSYAVSYLFIAIVWVNHHHLLHYATEATRLEDEFWNGLKEIAKTEHASLSNVVAEIDKARRRGNLSSAIRLFVLDRVRATNANVAAS